MLFLETTGSHIYTCSLAKVSIWWVSGGTQETAFPSFLVLLLRMTDKMKANLKGFYTRLCSRNTEKTENKQIFLTALRKVCQEDKSDIKASPKIYVHPQLCNRIYNHSSPLQSRLLSELNVFLVSILATGLRLSY